MEPRDEGGPSMAARIGRNAAAEKVRELAREAGLPVPERMKSVRQQSEGGRDEATFLDGFASLNSLLKPYDDDQDDEDERRWQLVMLGCAEAGVAFPNSIVAQEVMLGWQRLVDLPGETWNMEYDAWRERRGLKRVMAARSAEPTTLGSEPPSSAATKAQPAPQRAQPPYPTHPATHCILRKINEPRRGGMPAGTVWSLRYPSGAPMGVGLFVTAEVARKWADDNGWYIVSEDEGPE